MKVACARLEREAEKEKLRLEKESARREKEVHMP